jgi:uncharacterized membrane protein YfcA
MVTILKTVLGLMTSLFGFYYLRDAYKKRSVFSTTAWPKLWATGFVTNFFDTLGIGSFAQQTAVFKFFHMVDDRLIPGTMNVGNTIATVTQAFLYMSAFHVEPLTLISMSIAAPAGAVLGAGVVCRLPRRKIQLGMGIGLLAVALIILAKLLKLVPPGGEAIGLWGWKLAVAVVMSFVFGALQTIGVGFYAPCMAMVSILGMNDKTAFPIMMTATAMLMAAGSARFVKENAYDPKASVSLTVFGVMGVFLAFFLVREMSLTALKWVVLVAVLYTSIWMFVSARKKEPESCEASATK